MPAIQSEPPAVSQGLGTLLIERDSYGTHRSCLSCGYVHDVLTQAPVDVAAEEAALLARERRRSPSHGKLSI